MASIISERYALSLYEVAQDEKNVPQLLEQFSVVAELLRENPQFLKILSAPTIDFESKRHAINAAFEGKIDQYLLNFLLLITEKGRIGYVLEMQEAFKQRYYNDEGICEVTVCTAVEMDDQQTQKMQKKLEQITKKKVILKKKIDPSILGGVVVTIGNEQVDTSVRTRLGELAAKLSETIS